MGITKKSVVAAKPTKKRGRPAGSKNQPKFDGQARVKASQTLSSEGWIPPATDWELLAKRLQKALAVEMKTVEGMEKLFEEFKSVSKKVNELTFWQRIKLVFTGMY